MGGRSNLLGCGFLIWTEAVCADVKLPTVVVGTEEVGHNGIGKEFSRFNQK